MTLTTTLSASRASRDRLVAAAALAVALPLCAGFLNRIHPLFDSFAHFRLHLAVALLGCALALLVLRHGFAALTTALLAGVAIASTAGALPSLGVAYGRLQPENADQPVYRLMQINLLFDNRDHSLPLSLIGRVQPDVITLNEVTSDWAATFNLIEGAYPYSIVCPFPNREWGVAILSRRPFTTGTQPKCDRRGAFAKASVDFGGRTVDIASLHLGWPWPYEQAWQIGGLNTDLGTLSDAALLAGDLNATPWSATVAHVAAASRLALMPSPGATWLPAGLPDALRFAGLPIDQVFASDRVLVHSVSLLEAVGSDHLPVLVAFSIGEDGGKHNDSGETATAMAAAPKQPRS